MLNAEEYTKAVVSCAQQSEIYTLPVKLPEFEKQAPYYMLTRQDAVSACFHYGKKNAAILNLMCEEATNDEIYSDSNLFEVLTRDATDTQTEAKNKSGPNLIYSKNIRFGKDGIVEEKDVMSVAVPSETIRVSAEDTIKLVRDVTVAKNLETLIVNIPRMQSCNPITLCAAIRNNFRTGTLRRIVLCVKDDFSYNIVDGNFMPLRKLG